MWEGFNTMMITALKIVGIIWLAGLTIYFIFSIAKAIKEQMKESKPNFNTYIPLYGSDPIPVTRCKDCKYAVLVNIEEKIYQCTFVNTFDTLHSGLFYCAYGDKDYIDEDDLDSEIVKAEYHYEEGLGK